MSFHAALSPSRTKDFRQCPLLFRLRTIDRLPEPPSVEALRGTLVHAVLEHLFDADPAQRTEEAAQSLLEPQWQEHVEKSPEDEQLFEDSATFDDWFSSARTLIGNYFTMENPQFLQPDARETFVNATLPSGLHIRGIIDRIDKAPNGALRVVDYKTGKSPSPRFQHEAIFQMQFYAAALFISRGSLPARTQLIYLKDGRTLTYDPAPADVDSLALELDSTWSAIEERIDTGHFEPKTSPLCNWCKFKEFCPAFGGQAPPIDESGVSKLLTAKASTATPR
ncbi:RecB family exonuclease [Ancrocorticia populi]|uniref:RecB family exonuclease n=1 Tax=Ancrocorticia populi TaxID=2175228 RepID=UPI003F8F1543